MTDPKPDLKVVRSDLSEMLVDARNGATAFELENKYGLKRKEAKALATQPVKLPRGRRPKVTKPAEQQSPTIPENNQQPADDLPKQAPKYGPTYTGRAVGGGLILLGLVGAAVGGMVNWQFGFEAAGLPGALIGIVVDGGAALLMVAAGELLRQRNPLCLIALLLWFPFVGGSTYAALNYTGVRLGDYFQARGDVRTGRNEFTTKIEEAAGKLRMISEGRTVGQIEDALREARSFVKDAVLNKTDQCKTPTVSREACQGVTDQLTALGNAKARDGYKAEIAEWTRLRDALPPVASANPAADQIAQMSGSKVTAEQATSWWLRWLACVPGCSGVLLTIGVALLGKPAPR